MATVARGLGLRLSLPAGPRSPPLRLFTTSSVLSYAKPKKPSSSSSSSTTTAAAKPPPSSSTIPKDVAAKIRTIAQSQAHRSHPGATARDDLVRRLASKGTPTLLYESASHFWMKASAWAACLMFYGYAGINYYFTILHPPPDLAGWVGPAWAVICAATAGFGSYFLAAVFGIVRSVRAVPTASLLAKKSTLLPATARAETTPIHLEFTVKRLLPGKAKKILVAPGEVGLPYSLFAAARAPAVARPSAKSAAEAQELKKAQLEYDRNHLMTVPFRHAGQGMRAAWYGVQRALTRSGFMKVAAGKQKLKLDVHSGWALEDGRVLDQLCKITGPGAAKK